MTITISYKDYWDLWDESSQNPENILWTDGSDVTCKCPQLVSQGYERWIDLPGISLLIKDEEFHDDLIIQGSSEAFDPPEFGFQIVGQWGKTNAGQGFIYGGGFQAGGNYLVPKQRILKVDIHLEAPDWLSSFITDRYQNVSPELKQLIEGSATPYYQEVMTTTLPMRLALEQLLNCPFADIPKQMYLESKCRELIALRLGQLDEGVRNTQKKVTLKARDIDRIHAAKAILLSQIAYPPSLMELARLVELNDYKLKLGFRQLFGMTVFQCLYEQRMNHARELLAAGRMSVKEVARTVGYKNQSRFAAAFRKRFGTNPLHYLKDSED